MARGKKKVPEINSSSTADIAFLLLIFFLITTSMDTDSGLARRLPPPPEENAKKSEIDVKERNVLVVLINANNELKCGREIMDIRNLKTLRTRAKEFIANPNNDSRLPELSPVNIDFFGSVMVTKDHIISLQNDRGTSYDAYFQVQNELVAAYNELRDEKAREKWQKKYVELTEGEQKAIRDIYPQRISEAEPKNYGGKK
jgi:biopolymer transport protein ExbD